MIDIGRDDRSAARHLRSDKLRVEPLSNGNVLHLLSDDAFPGIVQLGHRPRASQYRATEICLHAY